MLIENVLGTNGIISNKLESYELRTQQLEMALAIEKSINEKRHLIVEAGTGVGKSLAYLVPFIFWAVKKRKKVVISTYTKTLQEQLINKDLPFLRNALRYAHTDICPNDSPPARPYRTVPVRKTLSGGRSGGNDGRAGFKHVDEFNFSYALCVGGQNYLCIRKFNQAQMHGLFETKKEVKELQKIIQWKRQTKSGLRSGLDFEPSQALWSKVCRESDLCFGKNCLFKDDCYYNKARRKEFKADILVTNHHLFFANLVNEGRVIPNFDAVVFDEAQTLEDVATNYFGIEISNFKVKFLIDSILNPKTGKGLVTRLFKPSGKTETTIQKILNEAREAGNLFFSEIIKKYGKGKVTTRIRKKGIINNYLNKSLSDLSRMLESLLNQAKTDEERLEIAAFANRCNEINKNISTIINQDMKECVYWTEIEKRVKYRSSLPYTNIIESASSSGPLDQRNIRCSLLAAPINVASEFEKQIFDKIRPVILTSATLSTNGNFNYIKERLGIPAVNQNGTRPARQSGGEDYDEKIIGSPFNFSKNALIYIPINIPDPNQEPDEYKNNIIKHIKDIISHTQGRSFILFTSFEMLNAAYEEIKDNLDSFTLFRQGDKPRYQLIEEFKTSHKPVLFGTTTFWQGVDVPGEALKCVIITKLPFAVPNTPIIEARMELLKAQNKDPFTYYQVPQAITLLRQGFGRLIRTKTDTGIVAILDPRIKSRYYGRYFLNSLPNCNIVSDIKDIKNFLNLAHNHED
ncbi:MAG: ATP-dependent DNA helicase (DNA-damage-inducible protein G) [Candidatus Scalindua rubra]|uniref:DNA 5'-3' helicase n=1 Tax=Candidatus Scalindua rubra TaxID=1872076 RepID=A0A1E3X9D8_9BACT|nr:MAG: ATP-dependent DNA helicase (DNA-damage-inducible protein G) [Candidatus Scalindua rubra]